ncbi:pheromone-regulated protein prm10 [Microbotryomycetes sp. JL201]|nr:pheromone-regulated protein prm10 [Microbotryomycetes sp. JL201]
MSGQDELLAPREGSHSGPKKEPPQMAASGAIASGAEFERGGACNDDIQPVHDRLDVFVDGHEVDGLPNLVSLDNEARARELLNAYSNTGTFDSQPPGARQITSSKHDEENLNEARADTSATMPGLSVLSALMALQQLNETTESSSTGPSPAVSGSATPVSVRGLSPAGSGGEEIDEDEAQQKAKFIARYRTRKAAKQALSAASTAIADASRFIASSATHLATDKPFRKSHSSTTLSSLSRERLTGSPTSSRAFSTVPRSHSSATLSREYAAVSPVAKSFSSSSLGKLVHNATRATSPSPPPSPGVFRPRSPKPGEGISKSVGRLAGQLGWEVGTNATRSDAARSSAGVLGGLVMATNSLAGVATSIASEMAPIPSKAGYHLSRYNNQPASASRKSIDSYKTLQSANGSPVLNPTDVSMVSHSQIEAQIEAAEADEDPQPLMMPSRRKKAQDLRLHLNSRSGSPTLKPSSSSASPSMRTLSPFRLDSPRKDYFGLKTIEYTDAENEAWTRERRRRLKAQERKKRRQVYITKHVAAILSRQEFILKLARSLMMFGAPTHRLEAQIHTTAQVLELQLQCIYLPSVMLISFGDDVTHTSELKVLKQPQGLDLGKMHDTFKILNKVVRDKLGVDDASAKLDSVLVAPPKYSLWQQLLIGGIAGAAIMPSAFYGSFIDCVAAIPLGALLVAVQVVASRNDMYSSLFEIVIACLNAILAGALARSKQFCFAAVASGSVVLILPGYIVLSGSLELANRSIISGSVRLVYSVLYSLFLGFGLSLGASIYQHISEDVIEGAYDFTCSALRQDAPWYRATIPQWWYFFTVPLFLLMLALRNGQPLYRRETVAMLLVGSAGWCCNFFSSRAFVGRPDINSAIGACATGFLGNVYAKWTHDSAFVIMVVGIFAQLPSGLANGGLLRFASDSSGGSSEAYTTAFTAAQSLVQVAIGLTVGLFVATALANVIGGGRRRGGHLSSL